MADYNSSYTGAEIDANIGKVANADTTPTSGSSNMVTSGGAYTAIDARLPKAGGTMTGNINMNDNSITSASQITMSTGGRITNLSTATDAQTGYAANVAYVLAKISASFAQFASAVLAVALTGLSTATNAAIEATDTIIVALGKLQAQINVRIQTNSEAQLKTLQITGAATLTNNEGTLTWNDTEKTLEFPVNANVTLQVGQEQLTYVKAAEALSNGDVVYASGAVGASGVIEVSKFIADGSINQIQVLGIATEDISLNGFGFITTFGKVRGLDTSAYTDGDILYASAVTAGALTSTMPTAPNQKISVAMVINSHATNGTLMVRPTLGSTLNDLHNVNITSVSNKQLLQYNSSNARWENVTNLDLGGTITATSIKGYRPTSTQTGTTYTFVLGDANTMIYANNASAQTYTVPPNSSVAFSVGDEIEVFNYGAGIVTFAAGSGVTILSKGSALSMSDQYAAAILKKQATDTWILIGDLA